LFDCKIDKLNRD